jgi:hypothetical protein
MTLNFIKISNIRMFFFLKQMNKKSSIFLLKKKLNLSKSFLKKSKTWKHYLKFYFYFTNSINSSFGFNFFSHYIYYPFDFKKKHYLSWTWELSLGIFFILFGFFSATSAITIIGSVADWDPLAAAVMLCWTEFFTKIFYYTENKSFNLKLINSFKIGINFGMFVDALKLTS